jgi:hypothetical protein
MPGFAVETFSLVVWHDYFSTLSVEKVGVSTELISSRLCNIDTFSILHTSRARKCQPNTPQDRNGFFRFLSSCSHASSGLLGAQVTNFFAKKFSAGIGVAEGRQHQCG